MSERKNTHFKAISRTVQAYSQHTHKENASLSFLGKIVSIDGILALAMGALTTIITIVIYKRTLAFPFQFDDLLNITKNFSIRSIDLKLSLFTSPRWIGELSNKLNFKLGHFCPWSYRLVNLIIHLFSGAAFGTIVWVTSSSSKRDSFLYQSRAMLTGLCMAFFLLHPVSSQTINYAIQARLEGLATLFSLLGVLAMVRYCTSEGKKSGYFLATACLTGFLSCGTKEIVIVAPILAFLIDLFFIAQFKTSELKKRILGHALFFGVVFLTISYYLGMAKVLKFLSLGHVVKNNRGNIVSAGVVNQIGAFEFLISEFKVIMHYLWIFLVPTGMSVEYDYKLASSIFEFQVWAPLAGLLTITGLFLAMARKTELGKILLFGWTWFIIAIAPRASIIPCAELVGDYKTYLASCGIFLIFSALILWTTKLVAINLKKIFEGNIQTSLNSSCFFVLTLIMAIGLDRRNNVWSDQELFWADIVQKSPNKARAHNNLAVALCEKGKFKESIAHLEKAIKLDQFYPDPWSNLAVSFSMLGRPQDSIAALNKAISIMPNYPEAYNNIGAILIGCSEHEKAIEPLKKAIELRPHYGKAYLNLGRAVGKDESKKEEAWQYFKKATELDCDSIEGYVVLGNESIAMGKFDQACEALQKAFLLGERSKGVLMNLAGCFCQIGQVDKGLEMFEAIYKSDKSDQSIAYNLALCHDMKGNFAQASQILKDFNFAQNCPEQAINLAAKCIEKTQGLDKAKEFINQLLENPSLDESRKKLVKNQSQRIALQERINSGNGVITGKEFNEIFGTGQQQEAQA